MAREIKASDKKPLSNFRASGGIAKIKAEESADGSTKLPTFDGIAYTGAPMTPSGWWGVIVVDLEGVIIPSQHRPVLRQHDEEQICGHTTLIEVGEEGIKVSGVFSGQAEHTSKVTDPAKNGFEWQLSVGAVPLRTEFIESGATTKVNGREVSGPITISRETELKEISFVPLGADDSTSVTVTASRGKSMFKILLAKSMKKGLIKAGKYSAEDVDKMSEEEAKAALNDVMAADDEEDDDEDDDEENDDDTDLEEEEKPKAKAKSSATKTAIQASRKEHAAELTRVGLINKLAASHPAQFIKVNGSDVNLFAHAVEKGWTPDRVELAILRASRPGAGVGSAHLHLPSDLQATDAVLESAILQAHRHSMKLEDDDYYFSRSPSGERVRRVPEYIQREVQAGFRGRYSDQVQQTAHTMFKGRASLHQVIESAFRANRSSSRLDLKSESGVRAMLAEWGHNEPAFRAEGASTTGISNILSNVMNKFALQGYLYTDPAWRKFCSIRMVNDFKPAKSINLLGSVMFKQLGPVGELENAVFGDQAFANQAAPYGIIGTIPWTHIVNDDLSILSTVPSKIGTGGGLALNDIIWTLKKNMYAGTVNGDDGVSFYRTTSVVTAAAAKSGTAYKANKMTGGSSAMSATALQTAKALFDNQIDPNGNPIGNSSSKPVLLHGPSNWQSVSSLLQAPSIVYGGVAGSNLQPDKNMWQGYAEPVMSPYMENANYVNSATAWELLADPAMLSAIEVAFYGSDTPAVLQAGPDYQFDKLGISIRGTMAMGATQQNFRGSVYSAGV